MNTEEVYEATWQLEQLGMIEENGTVRDGQPVLVATEFFNHLDTHAPDVLEAILESGPPWPRPPRPLVTHAR